MKIPEGWQLVPVEPTEEMREAYYACVPDRTGPVHAATQKWRVMLEAAPTPPAESRESLIYDLTAPVPFKTPAQPPALEGKS